MCARSDFKDVKKRKERKNCLRPFYYPCSIFGTVRRKKVSHETRNIECLFPKNEKLNIYRTTVREILDAILFEPICMSV